MPWDVEYTDEFEGWFDALEADQQVGVFDCVELKKWAYRPW